MLPKLARWRLHIAHRGRKQMVALVQIAIEELLAVVAPPAAEVALDHASGFEAEAAAPELEHVVRAGAESDESAVARVGRQPENAVGLVFEVVAESGAEEAGFRRAAGPEFGREVVEVVSGYEAGWAETECKAEWAEAERRAERVGMVPSELPAAPAPAVVPETAAVLEAAVELEIATAAVCMVGLEKPAGLAAGPAVVAGLESELAVLVAVETEVVAGTAGIAADDT